MSVFLLGFFRYLLYIQLRFEQRHTALTPGTFLVNHFQLEASIMRTTRSANRTTRSTAATAVGTLEVGKTYNYSGSLSNGETADYRFRIGANSSNKTLNVDTRVNGSLGTIALLNAQGNAPTTSGVSASASSDGNSNNGRISTAFAGIAPGEYSLRLQGTGEGRNSYNLRLKYQGNSADSADFSPDRSIDFSKLSDRIESSFSRNVSSSDRSSLIH
jgi:hypothetical protein